MNAQADAISAPGEPFDYFDLARLGRTDWRSVSKAALRIVLYPTAGLTIIFGVAIAVYIWLRSHGYPVAAHSIDAEIRGLRTAGPVEELLLIFVLYGFTLWGTRDAVVKSHRRPFLSLVSNDLRLDIRRILFAGTVWFLTTAAILVLWIAFYLWLWKASPPPTRWFFNRNFLIDAAIAICVIPIQSATEELIFRGWLTQVLGNAIRLRVVVMLIVAVLFSAFHGLDLGLPRFLYYVLFSLIFSTLTVREGRLESAIGAHAAHNLAVFLLVGPLITPHHGPTLVGTTRQLTNWSSLLFCAMQGAILYAAITWRAQRKKKAAPARTLRMTDEVC
jgi:membrane protease YdiL (CAAX protease family)